jgi:osmotically-inducible protein OsmY
MNARSMMFALVFICAAFSSVHAQQQSSAPADKAVSNKIANALVKAGIDPRTTSVQVVTTTGHVVYLKGLISDTNEVALAGKVAAQNAPGYKVVNQINSSFFDDPSHVNGGGQPK